MTVFSDYIFGEILPAVSANGFDKLPFIYHPTTITSDSLANLFQCGVKEPIVRPFPRCPESARERRLLTLRLGWVIRRRRSIQTIVTTHPHSLCVSDLNNLFQTEAGALKLEAAIVHTPCAFS